MFRRPLVAVAILLVFALPSVSTAQVLSDSTPPSVTSLVNSLTTPVRLAEDQFVVQASLPRPVVVKTDSKFASKTLMASLYATTATMQMLDVDSTLKSLNRGAVETNPLMSGLVNNRAAFIATKAGIAAATIYATSKIAKNSKLRAALTLVAINSAYAMIVKHNYSIARRP
jgi:hypothetical protein